MSKVYLIGGASRSGKSTVLQAFIEQQPMLAASTDAIRSAAKSMSSAEQNPKLFKQGRGGFGSHQHLDLIQTDITQALCYELDEAEETWKATAAFIEYCQRDGRDVVIEGVAIMPLLLANLSYDVHAVFVVNSSDQTETILQHSLEAKYDWLHEYDETTVRAYAKLMHEWNQYYFQQAKQFGFPIIDFAAAPFEASVQKAVDTLR